MVENSLITEEKTVSNSEIAEKGVHILAEFFNCKNEEFLTDKVVLRASLISSVEKAGLTYLSDSFYKFDNAGVTGVIVLSESHVAFHTWPERGNYVSLDVFTCNYTCDNTEKAHKLYQSIVEIFQPGKIELVSLRRG